MFIYPNAFQKMSVKLAVQVFSNSVYAAVTTCAKLGQLKSVTALNTANFIRFMNDLFNVLNSRQFYLRNPYACAFTENNSRVIPF